MVPFFLTVTLSCSQFYAIFSRLERIINLTPEQKTNVILEIRKIVPGCPVKITSQK